MSNAAKLKDRARSFEQKEQWKEALDLYQQLVDESSGDELETGLWNRIGDLHLRLSQTERAVEAYDRAVDAYAEAGLHNNAIALCRKILRIAPGRATVYRKLGQISASQGFLADARQNFLEYAQRMQRAGELDASFAALKEFADLSPDDVELRRLLAEQLQAHGRSAEAVDQLRILLSHLRHQGREEEGEEVARRILAIDPAADLSSLPAVAEPVTEESLALEIPALELELPVPQPAAPVEPPAEEPRVEPLPGLDLRPEPPPVKPAVQALEGLETSEQYASWGDEPVVEAEGALSLPHVEPEPASEEEEEEDAAAEPLPFLDVGEAAPEPPAPLPPPDPVEVLRARVAADPRDTAALRELVALLDARGLRAEAEAALDAAHRDLAARGLPGAALQVLRTLLERRPADTLLHQKQVEYAFRAGETAPLVRAYLDLARQLGSPRENPKARAVYQRVLELDPGNEEARRALAPPPPPPPAAMREEYVDLGALIMEDDEEEERTTRFVVPEEEPTGDEDRDFADMLAVFRQKVSENIGAEDSASHYDLGLAFMEMGLVDEAIAEFQVALRGGANPLATLEVLARCFVEKEQHAVAARVLERALRIPGAAEVELVGVLYQLGRCEEALGRAAPACGYYERVMAVDIRFRDAARRLEALRAGARL